MAAYNERILATSHSEQRRDRARRMLANVQPWLTRFEREEQAQTSTPAILAPQPDDDEFEVVWSGGDSLH